MKRSWIGYCLPSLLILLILASTLPAGAKPVQEPDLWQDGFEDDWGLQDMVDVQVDGGSLGLADSSVSPGQYVTSGLATSVLINPLVASIPIEARIARITAGAGDFLYFVSSYEVASYEDVVFYAYQLSTGEFQPIHTFEDSSESETDLVTGIDGLIYVGIREHLHRYTPGGGVQDLGMPIPGSYISRLAVAPSGRIYGIAGIRLFSFNPGTGGFSDHGIISTNTPDRSGLTVADDGRVYGSYVNNTEGRLFVYDPATGFILDKGQILGQQSINTLAAGPDGRIYGGTNTYDGATGRFFAYDPATDSVVDLAGTYGGVYALLKGPNGLIYGAARRNGWEAYLFVYNPDTGALKETGRIKAGDGHVSSLAWGTDGRVYGTQTQGIWHSFYDDPIFTLVVYDPAVTEFTSWDRIWFSHTVPADTTLRVDVLDEQANLLLIDVHDGDSLAAIDPDLYPALQLRAHLGGNGTNTPTIDQWSVEIISSWIPYTITGRVTDWYKTPFSGVLVDAGSGHTALTGADGTYTLGSLPTGAHRLTPSKAGYRFSPYSRVVYTPPNAAGQSFVILPDAVSTALSPGEESTLEYTDTQGLPTQVEVPAGAVTLESTLVLTPTLASSTSGFAFAGHGFELELYQDGSPVPGFAFETPVTVTIHYSDDDLKAITDENELVLLYWDGSNWLDAALTCEPPSTYERDTGNQILSVPICHLTRFGLFGPTLQFYLPLVLRSQG